MNICVINECYVNTCFFMLCLQLSWDMYLFKILSRSHVTVGADTEVVVLHEESLVQLCAVVGSYNKDAQKAR